MNNINFALSEVNGHDMPKKNPGSFDEIAFGYLDWWASRGFELQMAEKNLGFFGAATLDTQQTVDKLKKLHKSTGNVFISSNHQDPARVRSPEIVTTS